VEYPISLYIEASNVAIRRVISFARTAVVVWTLLACTPAFASNGCEQLASFATPEVEITATAVVMDDGMTAIANGQ
jgi:hypothetical protein